MKAFNKKEDGYDNDDLQYALQNNPPESFSIENITHIVAEVCGENDELEWWWILKMKDGRFFLLSGARDYTGWDCQSSIDEHGYFNTAEKSALHAPLVEKHSNRSIQINLLRQITGEQPLFTYIEEK